MSVALLLKNSSSDDTRLYPIATQERFVRVWMPAIEELGLEWVGLAETGFLITIKNHPEVVSELRRLRAWFEARHDAHSVERLDRALPELEAFRFEAGSNAFLG